MDEGRQALSDAEQQQLDAQMAVAQAEAQTGQVAARRTATEDPTSLDPRFDRDDLRQGKPPPAIKQRRLPRTIKIRRPRAKKGQPFKQSGEKGASGATTDGEAEEADMTEDEVEVEDEEVVEGEGQTTAGEQGTQADDGKKGVFGKLLGKNTTL